MKPPKPLTPKPPKPKILSLPELMALFPDEPAAIKYMESVLWNYSRIPYSGPRCPYCYDFRVKPRKNRPPYYHCTPCKKDFTIRSCTIFERSHIPLHKWIWAIYFVLTERKGISSINMSIKLGITQKSAWFMLNRLRAACNRDLWSVKLDGTVEVDEVYLGGLEKNKHESKRRHAGRGAVNKTPVVGARSRSGRVRVEVAKSTDKETLQKFVRFAARKESTVYTDEHRSYRGLKDHFTDHKTVNHSMGEYVVGDVHTNSIESVNAMIKGNYRIHNSYSKKHTQRYLNEVTFRLNSRNKDTLERIAVLIRRASGLYLTYEMLKRGSAWNIRIPDRNHDFLWKRKLTSLYDSPFVGDEPDD
jgi:transposase-like protein